MCPEPLRRVTDRDVQYFERVLGTAYVRHDAVTLAKYSRDETEDLAFTPDIVLLPGSAEEVAAVLRYCHTHRIPVTPRAAGTGLSGGALPVYGGVVLSVERMHRILEIDTTNQIAVVEPGVITADLQRAVEAHGLFYPPDPASRDMCMIGGNVAENAGGPRAVKYGVTKDYVLGLEVVLPTGERIRTGGKLYKNVAGYNLTQLFVGSEGTLGVFTEIILRLIPRPQVEVTLLVPFMHWEDATATITDLFRARILPAALEFVDAEALAIARTHAPADVPLPEGEALLLIHLDGPDTRTVEREMVHVGDICERHRATDVQVADTPARRTALWQVRRKLGEWVKHTSVYKEEDAVVPRDRLADLIHTVRTLADQYGFRAACYGHAGDGNVHINILKMGLDDTTWHHRLPEAIRALFAAVVRMGGTITGEHGVGWVQREYLPIALDETTLALHAGIKRLFDPHGIMNPGKVLPERYMPVAFQGER